jgi:hypothetical protein
VEPLDRTTTLAAHSARRVQATHLYYSANLSRFCERRERGITTLLATYGRGVLCLVVAGELLLDLVHDALLLSCPVVGGASSGHASVFVLAVGAGTHLLALILLLVATGELLLDLLLYALPPATHAVILRLSPGRRKHVKNIQL